MPHYKSHTTYDVLIQVVTPAMGPLITGVTSRQPSNFSDMPNRQLTSWFSTLFCCSARILELSVVQIEESGTCTGQRRFPVGAPCNCDHLHGIQKMKGYCSLFLEVGNTLWLWLGRGGGGGGGGP